MVHRRPGSPGPRLTGPEEATEMGVTFGASVRVAVMCDDVVTAVVIVVVSEKQEVMFDCAVVMCGGVVTVSVVIRLSGDVVVSGW